MPKKPGGCNPKALEHPTGLPNPQPSDKPLAPRPPQALITLEPNTCSSVKRELIQGGGGNREGTPRTAKLLQAHGMKTHELTKNTAGQSQPHGSHGYVYDC